MINKVIAYLQKIENEASDKLLQIFEGKQDSVEDSFYAETVFKTQNEYGVLGSVLRGKIQGSFRAELVETPLTFVRGKEGPVFFSLKNQGIDFGFTLVDYRSSQPLVIVVVEFKDSKYEYKSIKFDSESNSYVDSEFSSQECDKFEDLSDLVLTNLDTDIKKWLGK